MSIGKKGNKRILVNVSSNITYVILSSLIIVFLTPYLIRRLGIELYGLIPLTISFVSYFNLLTASVAGSLSRYVMLSYHNNDYYKSNTYFNSALWPLVILSIVLLIPMGFIGGNFASIFKVPDGFGMDAGILFMFIISGALITSISTPFMLGFFIKHRFDLSSLVKILGKIVQVGILIILFEAFNSSLVFYGVSYLIMSIFMFLLLFYIQKKLVPELSVNYKMFERASFLDMSTMSFWGAINQVGALLYVTIAILLANILLGSEQAGKYGAIAQWGTLLGVLGGSISSVFTPIVYEYIAENNIDKLIKQICRAIKYVTLIMGFPVGFLCALSEPIISQWLGDDFSNLSLLMCLLIAPWLITIGIRPVFPLFTGLKKVEVPAMVTMVIGIINVILIYVLIQHMDMGLLAIAFSLLICHAGKNLFFTPIYAAIITEQSHFKFLKELFPGLTMAVINYFICIILNNYFPITGVGNIIVLGLGAGVIYVSIVYMSLVTDEDKKVFNKII